MQITPFDTQLAPPSQLCTNAAHDFLADAASPRPMGEEAFHGIAGEAVNAVAPFTEGDRHGILLSLLTLVGNRVGKGVRYPVPGGGEHRTNEYLAIVGATALARKSTVLDVVKELWRHVEPDFQDSGGLCAGISSGEALIERLQDRPAGSGCAATQPDKRLLLHLDEFGAMFEVLIREGNSLGELVKIAFGGGPLQAMIKRNGQRATGYHFSVIAASTVEQLRSALGQNSHRKLRTRTSDGFTNRFLWCFVQRARKKSRASMAELKGLAVIHEKYGGKLKKVLATAANRQVEMNWHADAEGAWDAWYEQFDIPPGMDGYLGRGEAHVIRLAMIYALLDSADSIHLPHLKAAVEVWRYCRDSAVHIFSAPGDTSYESSGRIAQMTVRLLQELGRYPGLSKSQILHDVFRNNRRSAEIDTVLSSLLKEGIVQSEMDTSTHPATVRYWVAGQDHILQ